MDERLVRRGTVSSIGELCRAILESLIVSDEGWNECRDHPKGKDGPDKFTRGRVEVPRVILGRSEGWRKAGQNGAANEFGDLRDYGVSEGVHSVHPIGYPILASAQDGRTSPVESGKSRRSMEGKSNPRAEVSRIFAVRSGLHPPRKSWAHTVGSIFAHLRLAFDPPADVKRLNPCAVGVGNDPDTISPMVGTKGGSWYAVPVRIIPDRGQVSENGSKPSTKQSCDVLHDEVSRSKLASQSGDFAPKAAARSFKACTGSSIADVLAGEPSADDIDGNSICAQSFAGKGSHVVVAGDVRPVLGEDAAGELFDFTEGDGLETACAFEAKAKPSNTGKEIEDAQLPHSPLLPSERGDSAPKALLFQKGLKGDEGEAGGDEADEADGHASIPSHRRFN
jgi:hypothetical protein